MSKLEINNQIVLLRKSAKRAREDVIKKLTRDVGMYRKKKGTEAQKAKNQRKAERIVAEILSVKKVKRDTLTKFALRNTLSLKEILENRNSEPLKRIMARIANQKVFSEKIFEFKTEYPNYMEFLDSEKKKRTISKKSKLENKKNAENGFNKNNNKNQSTSQSIHTQNSKKNDDNSDGDSDENSFEHSENEEMKSNDEVISNIKSKVENESESEDKDEDTDSVSNKITKNKEVHNKLKTKAVNNTTKASKKWSTNKRKNAKEDDEKHAEVHPEVKVPKKKTNDSKVISKEAIVKKFNDILQEKDSSGTDKHQEIVTMESNIQVEKEVDPFFVTGNGDGNYLSIALTKSKSTNAEDDYNDDYSNKFNKRNFSRQQNDKFFSKISKNNGPKFNSNLNKPNSRWQGQKNNARLYEKEKLNDKSNFKSFNRGNKDKSKSFNKNSNVNFENNSNQVLHPSWEAKKKQQEILQKGFQGKKIVFGDDI